MWGQGQFEHKRRRIKAEALGAFLRFQVHVQLGPKHALAWISLILLTIESTKARPRFIREEK